MSRDIFTSHFKWHILTSFGLKTTSMNAPEKYAESISYNTSFYALSRYKMNLLRKEK